MTKENKSDLVRIRRALISVSDKTGIVDFARELKRFSVEIISTGGTAAALRDAGLAVRDVSDVTRFPEMMDGRIKTLHPRIHGGLLAVRDNPAHLAAMGEHDIEPIDMVVVNLYPFEKTIARKGVTLEEAIEQIDIGGPAMIRSAAKNNESVTVVVSPEQYPRIVAELNQHAGSISFDTRRALAHQAFQRTATYDAMVSVFLKHADDDALTEPDHPPRISSFGIRSSGPEASSIEMASSPPELAQWTLRKTSDLRYGENPHQVAALYDTGGRPGIGNAELLSGKEMSFNNYVDADAAWQLVCDFDDLACAIIKHTNPAGVALGASNEEAYRKALACDPVSAFGGIVAFNAPVDEAAARAVTEIFTEVIIAPEYEPTALEVLKAKKNLRVLSTDKLEPHEGLEYKQISGGMLVQTRDTHRLKREDLKVVSKRGPSDQEIDDLLFAWTVCKHTKSNAIVYVRDRQTVGVGAGQMSRVDSVKIGAMRAQLPIAGSVLASDAFFPFRDGLDEAARHGITAVIQPGGSVRDAEVIAAADEHGLAMVFTGVRHFKH
ncbi:MAG: phosphoribosylaminoimidazolecarboxamide formyltransferase / cyclohydrolase [Solirubrobacteraceae bacterium]|jgi:phosphoribosylaminoimidazolecarboxamide formyltransferase/IMP cyclohydrolase|nr:phosphoribosylaminoimidazolecarboxamide formyltransferase / cyclohydrolase [Solirubrobacteraceae bacterium]